MRIVNLAEKMSLLPGPWQPRIVAELNDFHVKVAKLHGEFVWHAHEAEDELFLVTKGHLRIELRDGVLDLDPGELVVIPKGVEHRPVAAEEVEVLLVEPKTTVNTGNVVGDRTVTPDWL